MKAPYKSFRKPTIAYVPKWHKKPIMLGDLLAGKVFPSMIIHVWLAKKNSKIMGIAVSKMKKDRTIEFENMAFASPLDIFEIPLTK